jgi:hypothetical protein
VRTQHHDGHGSQTATGLDHLVFAAASVPVDPTASRRGVTGGSLAREASESTRAALRCLPSSRGARSSMVLRRFCVRRLSGLRHLAQSTARVQLVMPGAGVWRSAHSCRPLSGSFWRRGRGQRYAGVGGRAVVCWLWMRRERAWCRVWRPTE